MMAMSRKDYIKIAKVVKGVQSNLSQHLNEWIKMVVFGQSENLNTYDWEADKRIDQTWLEKYKNFMNLFKKD